MANSRRFFRFDVQLRIYLQREQTELKEADKLLKSQQRHRLQQQVHSLDGILGQLLEDLSNHGSHLYQLFYGINQRLNYLKHGKLYRTTFLEFLAIFPIPLAYSQLNPFPINKRLRPTKDSAFPH
ncbi:hypothetical protein THIOSC15_1430002 [uncultured Thiomicrorhabdus sp.]